jgi:hypothetical protein
MELDSLAYIHWRMETSFQLKGWRSRPQINVIGGPGSRCSNLGSGVSFSGREVRQFRHRRQRNGKDAAGCSSRAGVTVVGIGNKGANALVARSAGFSRYCEV